jgi:hypothetical protein
MSIDTYRKQRMGMRRSAFKLWIIYTRPCTGDLFFPHTDVHGNAIAYSSKNSAAADLYQRKQLLGNRNAYLQKVGPIS